MDSILASVKKFIGPSASYDYFDSEIISHINSVLMSLTQIGVGPSDGFTIEDDTAKWTDFANDTETFKVDWIKSYVSLSVKLLFDPPTHSSHLESIQKQIDRLEWRINFAIENTGKEEIQNG